MNARSWVDQHVLDLQGAHRMMLPGHLSWPFRTADFYRETALREVFSVLGGRVLDFGCGNKPYENALRSPKIQNWTGVDLQSRTTGEDASNKADVFWDGTKLPFQDGSFDVVLATQVFEHVADLELALREIARILPEGGTLVATVPMTSVLHEEPHDYRRLTPYGMDLLARPKDLHLKRAIALGGPITAVGTLIVCHLNPLNRLPVFGKVLHALLIASLTQLTYWLEKILYKVGFKQRQLTLDYLFVLTKSKILLTTPQRS